MKAHPPVLAVIDLDGVVYNFEEAVAKWIHVSTGRPLETMPTPANTWHFNDAQWDPPIPHEKLWLHVKDGVLNGHIWGCGDPIDGVDTMTAWRSILEPLRVNDPNFYIQVVSARGIDDNITPIATALTGAWLNGWGFHYDRLSIVTSESHKVDEVEYLRKQLGVDPENVFAIDDRPMLVEEYRKVGYSVALASRAHNAENPHQISEGVIWGRLSFLDWCLRLQLELAKIS